MSTSAAGRAALVAGGGALVVACLLALSGVVRAAFYDTDARGPAAKVAAKAQLDLLGNVAAIDRNVKHLRDATGREEGAYGANLAGLNASEAAIPSLARSTARLLVNVRALRSALAEVSATNDRVGARMAGLTRQQEQALASLQALAARTNGLVATMATLVVATGGLRGPLARIDGLAAGIAGSKLPPAVAKTNELNSLLPPRVPPKRYEPLK